MSQLAELFRPETPCATDPLDVRLHAPISDVVVVRVLGAVNESTTAFLTERVRQQYHRAQHVIVDLGDVTFLGADGVDVLRTLLRETTRAGIRLYPTADHEAVCGPLRLADLDGLLAGPSADLVLARLMCRRSTAVPRTQLEWILADALGR